MTKKGRKRKNAKRHPCGKIDQRAMREQKYGPTAELLAKRISALAIAGISNPLDSPSTLNMADSWLGIMRVAEVIDEHEYDAALEYQRLHRALYRQGAARSNFADFVDQPYGFDPSVDSPALQRIEEKYHLTVALLKEHSRKTMNIVNDIVLYEQFKQFMDMTTPRPTGVARRDAEDRARFKEGLNLVANAYGLKKRDAA